MRCVPCSPACTVVQCAERFNRQCVEWIWQRGREVCHDSEGESRREKKFRAGENRGRQCVRGVTKEIHVENMWPCVREACKVYPPRNEQHV